MDRIVSKKTEKKVHTLGSRFSQDVHGIFTDTKKAVHTIIEENELAHAFSVPFIVVIAAAILTAIGKHLWAQVFFEVTTSSFLLQVISSVVRGLLLFVDLIWHSIAFLIMWVGLTIVFHFVGSIVASSDITGKRTFGRTLKLTGFMFAPMFLNILPFFPLITGYWAAYIAYEGMKANYETTERGALIIVLPYLFTVAYGTFIFLKAIFGL